MESDDSCETTSLMLQCDAGCDLFGNQISDHQDTKDENCSSCDGYLSNVEVLSDSCLTKHYHTYSRKLKEQGKKIKLLEQERIGFLEQIANLYSSLEKKQQELVDVLQLSEEKAKYHVNYMAEVSSLLAELKTLFPEYSNGFDIENHTLKDQSELQGKKELSNSNDAVNLHSTSTTTSENGACCSEFQRDHRGRAILNALSATVCAAKNMNSRKHIKNGYSPQTPQIFNDLPSKSLNDTNHNSDSTSAENAIATEVRILPSFCWNADHVLYWLREYVCLPGGCLEAASRLRLDGKQLTSVFEKQIEKQLHLCDEGLRRKFFTALEDLRIHGPPGISRYPGPSHISYQWICDVWLKHQIGLVQLIPLFAIRRVDGRMLSSLISYKHSKHSIHHRNRRKSKSGINDNNNSGCVVISNPNDNIPIATYQHHKLIDLKANRIQNNNNNASDSSVRSIPSVPSMNNITTDIIFNDNSTESSSNNRNEYMARNWQVAGRKEMLQILLGLSHNTSSSSSGADLSVNSRYLLGKKEAESLRAAIELLNHHNFNIELIEQIRAKYDFSELDLLYWTNEHISKWLSNLGLSDFVHGIDASGLHGAYMVLDSTFDFNELIKRLHIPLNVANFCRLGEHLQKVLKPARDREGISTKRRKMFRRRSVSRLNYSNNLMQRSKTSVNEINGSYSSLTSSSECQIKSPTNHNQVSMNGNLLNMNHNKNTLVSSCTKTDVIRDAESLNLANNGDVDLTFNNPIGLTPRREKRRILTVTGDLINTNRLARVFTRGRKASLGVAEQSNKLLSSTQISRQLSTVALDNNNSVNNSTDNLDWSSDVEDKSSTLVRKQSVKGSDNSSILKQLSAMDYKKATPSRQGVQPHEAPPLDPFGTNCGRSRIRILLGQTSRLASLTGTSSVSVAKSNPNSTVRNIFDNKEKLACIQSHATYCMIPTLTDISLTSKLSTDSISSISSLNILQRSNKNF
ncbi:Liprin-alpha-3 [Schistosoma japonicum]|uniref:Liprin-alpha-3 n=1 Tax=Schistosoma japonicum TaxID=6182 RepID=A0A4Z2DN56_SCHJA|nr:Liprin-alpha-3 [Schistosoma japonicum]